MAQKFIGVTLPIRMGQTGMFDQSTTVIQQVRSNLKNLILTKKGERVGQPELGCDLWKILFEPLTGETLERAKVALDQAIERWIPFIELVNFQIKKTDDDQIISITCLYRFRNNPNLTDQVTVLGNQLGLPSIEIPSNEKIYTEAETELLLSQLEQTREARANAVRLRRAESL